MHGLVATLISVSDTDTFSGDSTRLSADRTAARQPRNGSGDVEVLSYIPDAPPLPLVHQKNPDHNHLSGKPIRYYRPRGSADIRQLIDEGFQAFNAARLGEACRIFTDKMLLPEHDTTIGLTVAGALTPAGLGGCIVELMERGLVDFVISTGANLYHDLHYALNFTLHRGSPFVDDVELYEDGVIRIYDVLFPATVLLETDAYIRDFLVRSGLNGPVSTAELHYALGRDLIEPAAGLRAVLRGRRGGRHRRARSSPRRPATARSA